MWYVKQNKTFIQFLCFWGVQCSLHQIALKHVALDPNGRHLKWTMAFSDWSQMADGHLSWS